LYHYQPSAARQKKNFFFNGISDSLASLNIFGGLGSVMEVAVDEQEYLYVAGDQVGLYLLHYGAK
jgi:hypothetical protein